MFAGKLENVNRGINIKRGLPAKCEMGCRPGGAPVGGGCGTYLELFSLNIHIVENRNHTTYNKFVSNLANPTEQMPSEEDQKLAEIANLERGLFFIESTEKIEHADMSVRSILVEVDKGRPMRISFFLREDHDYSSNPNAWGTVSEGSYSEYARDMVYNHTKLLSDLIPEIDDLSLTELASRIKGIIADKGNTPIIGDVRNYVE